MATSVGAIIRNSEGKILLIDRINPPYGWAGPAGHVDPGETPVKAIAREVAEEVGLKISNIKEIIHEYVPWNNCRNHQGHDWFVYGAGEWSGNLQAQENEVKNAKWISPDELNSLALEPVWKFWFEKLKII